MELLIISGLSGAGKSRAADVLEDLDYFCMDNVPAAMLPRLAEFYIGAGSSYEHVAVVTDARDRKSFGEIFGSLQKLREMGCGYRILFVEADLATVVKRYKETRRPHPLQSRAGTIEDAVRRETELLLPLRESADYVINTTNLTLGMLQAEIYRLFVGEPSSRQLSVNVMSFGFKHGIPIEADMVFDVRFLPNPYYVESLRRKTGLDDEVYGFIFSHATAREFLELLCRMVDFLIPQYIEEGKRTLTIAIGCTGGHHRSVAVARALTEYIKDLGQSAENNNRDIER
ncbi:MAG: RNase adapter RapZ [Butyricicoccus sp.]|nr:RNase adapter RapZ [Butyricicoccus sp.]